MPSNVKLLLVDDNPMVLGMLQQALASLAEVSTANDSADGLLKAVEEVPDLLVSDHRMPGMDGRQLLEKLKSRPATAGISVILMASKGDISERLSALDGVEDLLEKPFFLRDAVRRIKRVVDRIALEKLAKAPTAADGVLRGSLAQMNVIDLVQSLEMGRKSCLLTMLNGDDRCEIYFTQGQAKHAVYGATLGDEAVFKVLRWTEGNFEIDFTKSTTQESTTLNTQGLLMEGLRLLDEAARDGAESGGSTESDAEGEDVLLDT
ncbi:MAG TPA: response regulator [Terriglobales bacterium]|nr:response regulator [Terriglobales bacterium]